jgi:hypothetical protein
MPWTAFTLAVRRLLKAPLFTVVTLVPLAVGIGANAAIFSVIYGVLLKPLPFAEPDRLVSIWHTAPGMGIPQLNDSPSTYFIYREQGQRLPGHRPLEHRLGVDHRPGRARAHPDAFVTDGFLPVLASRAVAAASSRAGTTCRARPTR